MFNVFYFIFLVNFLMQSLKFNSEGLAQFVWFGN